MQCIGILSELIVYVTLQAQAPTCGIESSFGMALCETSPVIMHWACVLPSPLCLALPALLYPFELPHKQLSGILVSVYRKRTSGSLDPGQVESRLHAMALPSMAPHHRALS